jgi:hypothetical protein
MLSLSQLPAEIISDIVFHLIPYRWNEYSRAANRATILRLSKTNRAIWRTARPFLYHDILIDLQCIDSEASQKYQLRLQTSLLCRTLQENPALAIYVRALELNGLLAKSKSDFCTTREYEQSSVLYSTFELTGILTLCSNTRHFRVYGCLEPNFLCASNQILSSCLKSMAMLETLQLCTDYQSRVDPIVHFLTVASIKLKTLDIGPHEVEYPSHNLAEWPADDEVVPSPRFTLCSLTLPANTLPLTAFTPWIQCLNSLSINDLIVSKDQTSQGAHFFKTILPSLTSNLQHLSISMNSVFDPPSLSDLDTSQCPVLVTFTYHGPWLLKSRTKPADICQTLLSKRYQSLILNVETWRRRHKVKLKHLQVLNEAFTLAHLQDRSPYAFTLNLNFEEFTIYKQKEAEEMQDEAYDLVNSVEDRGADVECNVILPDNAEHQDG